MGGLALTATLTSCNDWLTLYPKDKIVEENFWEDKKDLESVRNEAYKNMISESNLNKYLIWGELRSDNFDRNPTVTNQDLMDLMNVNLQPTSGYFDWSGFYATINYCNKVIQHGPEILKKDLSFSQGDWEAIRAEMYALRALNYFYLTRTFDSIPLVMSAINDDSEVTYPKAVSQKAVLDTLVNQLEYICTTNMVEDYGNSNDNKGLITGKAIHTILADIYLWRASIQEQADKTAADADYNKCIEHCQYVIDKMDEEYQKDNGSSRPGAGGSSTTDSDNPYHLYLNEGKDNVLMTDGAYNYIFGNKNSRESIFELQLDGTKNNNNMVTNFFRGTGDQGAVGSVIASSQVGNNANEVDGASGGLFYKTDLRRWTTFYSYEEGKYAVAKYTAQTINQKKLSDNTTATGEDKVNPAWRTSASANWIFYRISDVLLMKAEALCRLNTGATQLTEAFKLVEQIYNRSNPLANNTEKLDANDYQTQDALEGLILRERRREFFGEGKRWFDIVRYALRQENSSEVVFELIQEKFSGSAQNVARNKYKQGVQVLYAPIYENEIKANPNLNQNPIWSQTETIIKN